eukprot:4509149-Amphidinium_carterae.1
MKLLDFVPKGAIHFKGETMMQMTQSDYLQQEITHSHISHFECVLDVTLLDSHHMGTPEVFEALMTGQRGKISAT